MKKLLLPLLIFISLNAFAVDPTQGPLQQDPSLCSYGYNPNCNQGAAQPKKIIRYKTIYIPSKYGALAFNQKTGITGGAINADSLQQAKKLAIKHCENGGKNAPCKVIVWVRNGCIAGAVNSRKQLFKAVAETSGQAEKIALNRCQASGSSGCEIAVPEGCSIP